MGAPGSRILFFPLAGFLAVGAACQKNQPGPPPPDSARPLSGTVTDTDLTRLQQDDGQWVMPAKNYASTRFSGLNEINTSNVKRLGVSWTFSTGVTAGHEGAPLVVADSGGEFGVRGWLTALDAGDGGIAWRAYSTGPDKDVLIGSSYKPFYASDRGTDLGLTTWPGDAWRIGGGTVWGWISYDPDL